MNETPCKWTRIAPGYYESHLGVIERVEIERTYCSPAYVCWNIIPAGEREACDAYNTLSEAKAAWTA